jgi:hypothetical protein
MRASEPKSQVEDSHREAVREHTQISVLFDLSDIPVAYEYDPESGEVTASNDDLRILAVGSTPREAEERFLEALARWLQTEIRAGKALPVPLREQVTLSDHRTHHGAPGRRGTLQPA